jgi:D-alanine-D-alanine ligase-like ATP-grasp enzyme
MLRAAEALTRAGIRYFGPRPAVMETCYDKLQATRLAAAEGIDCPATTLASSTAGLRFPLIIKPRRGSDSLGVRLLRRGPLPGSDYLAQEWVRGTEITVAVLAGHVGRPLAIALAPGTVYSFARKYLRRPRRAPVSDLALSARVRDAALKLARLFALNWAARLDFICEPGGRLCFLECDAAPLVGIGSAFAESLAAAGVGRAEQLALLTA